MFFNISLPRCRVRTRSLIMQEQSALLFFPKLRVRTRSHEIKLKTKKDEDKKLAILDFTNHQPGQRGKLWQRRPKARQDNC